MTEIKVKLIRALQKALEEATPPTRPPVHWSFAADINFNIVNNNIMFRTTPKTTTTGLPTSANPQLALAKARWQSSEFKINLSRCQPGELPSWFSITLCTSLLYVHQSLDPFAEAFHMLHYLIIWIILKLWQTYLLSLQWFLNLKLTYEGHFQICSPNESLKRKSAEISYPKYFCRIHIT